LNERYRSYVETILISLYYHGELIIRHIFLAPFHPNSNVAGDEVKGAEEKQNAKIKKQNDKAK